MLRRICCCLHSPSFPVTHGDTLFVFCSLQVETKYLWFSQYFLPANLRWRLDYPLRPLEPHSVAATGPAREPTTSTPCRQRQRQGHLADIRPKASSPWDLNNVTYFASRGSSRTLAFPLPNGVPTLATWRDRIVLWRVARSGKLRYSC